MDKGLIAQVLSIGSEIYIFGLENASILWVGKLGYGQFSN